MKRYSYHILILALMVNVFSSCINGFGLEEEEEEEGYDVTFYKLNNQSDYDFNDFLQASITCGSTQFATFGEIGSDGLPGSFNKAYIFDQSQDLEAIILFDENSDPAFIYNIDLVTGKKQSSVNEFVRIDDNSFYYRIYHYDWINRIGTLLFETVITKNGANYESSPSFEIEDLDFGIAKQSEKKVKGNRSFYTPLSRLDLLQKSNSSRSSLNKSNDFSDDWNVSFDKLRNSNIADWLVKTRKAGVVLTLTGLGVSNTVVGAPVGAWFIAGGGALVLGSTALEMVLTDRWFNKLNEIWDFISDGVSGIKEMGDDTVEIVQDYSTGLRNWLNENIDAIDINGLLDSIEEEEIITTGESLDDLPDSNGVLQIGLSWDTPSTDIDLWVIDPSGEKIYYAHSTSASGGYLDRDDTDGFGPENVYWSENIPQGEYTIKVHYFGGSGITNYTIKLSNGLGFSESYTGILNLSGQVNHVRTFNVNANNIH